MASEQPSGTPEPGATPPAGDTPAPGTPPASTPPAPAPGSDQFDPKALTQDQLNQVLEHNPEIWKAPRLAELREKGKKYDAAETARQKAEEDKLKEEGKFKELSEKQAQETETLKKQLQDRDVNQALTNKLAPLGVVDLEGALQLADKSKVKVAEDGTISGIDDVVEALKKDKAYLFNSDGSSGTPNLGSPSNPGNPGGPSQGAPAKFKRSQLQDPAFYKANEAAIDEAYKNGQIEDDLS